MPLSIRMINSVLHILSLQITYNRCRVKFKTRNRRYWMPPPHHTHIKSSLFQRRIDQRPTKSAALKYCGLLDDSSPSWHILDTDIDFGLQCLHAQKKQFLALQLCIVMLKQVLQNSQGPFSRLQYRLFFLQNFIKCKFAEKLLGTFMSDILETA